MTEIIKSVQDCSINYVSDLNFESRFVQRTEDYFIIYVSSFNGCDQTCRMCHLTATGQTDMKVASLSNLRSQWLQVLKNVPTGNVPKKVHLNFMARGEPLLSPVVQNDMLYIVRHFHDDVNRHFGLNPKDRLIQTIPIVSTIFPRQLIENGMGLFERTLERMVMGVHDRELPRVYYSLYSANPRVRKKWLPNAMNLDEALHGMRLLKDLGLRDNKIHYAFIKGVNDSEADVTGVLDALWDHDLLDLKWNIVRYNPYSEKYGEESSQSVIDYNVELLRHYLGADKVDVIPRVGVDVKASCGMFVEKDNV